MRARTLGAMAMLVPALLAVVAAGYLTASHFSGSLPVCGPLVGCEVVASSSYSTVLGVPIALAGTLAALSIAGLCVAWWRTGSRHALRAAYVLGLAGVVGVAYLTFLELVVIRAICSWCVVFGVSIVAAWVVSLLLLRRTPEPASDGDPGRAAHGRAAHNRAARRRRR